MALREGEPGRVRNLPETVAEGPVRDCLCSERRMRVNLSCPGSFLASFLWRSKERRKDKSLITDPALRRKKRPGL